MTKLQIMNEIASISGDPLLNFSVCNHYASANKKTDLLKVLSLYKVKDPNKIFFFDICCYWVDDDYKRHYVFNRCRYGQFPIEEVPNVR